MCKFSGYSVAAILPIHIWLHGCPAPNCCRRGVNDRRGCGSRCGHLPLLLVSSLLLTRAMRSHPHSAEASPSGCSMDSLCPIQPVNIQNPFSVWYSRRIVESSCAWRDRRIKESAHAICMTAIYTATMLRPFLLQGVLSSDLFIASFNFKFLINHRLAKKCLANPLAIYFLIY